MQSDNILAFLSLIRLGIGHQANFDAVYDWASIKELADKHELSAVVLDGIEILPERIRPSQKITLQWIGEVMKYYEARYTIYKNTIGNMAGWYQNHGFRMMVLKGFACSLDWPKPNHRPCGDIDIWQFGAWKEADKTLSERGIVIDNSHHHHTVFYWNGFMVENHYDFVNIHHSKSNAQLEHVFKELGADDSYYVDVLGNKVYLPSPNLHALFLLRHTMIEFAATGIKLRQLLDWAFFSAKHGKEIDWKWLEGILEKFGMMKLYSVFNAICVMDLGFDNKYLNRVQSDLLLKDRVLRDILSPEFGEEMPSGLFKRLVWKCKRYRENEWKRQLICDENRMCAFWRGVWNHLLKPSSI